MPARIRAWNGSSIASAASLCPVPNPTDQRPVMKRLAPTNLALRFPWLILVAAVVVTGLFATRFPSVKFDNDPENMLAEDEPVRVFHHRVKEKYALYDFVIVGIVNETHPDGVWNVDTLTRIDDLTRQLVSLQRNDAGQPTVTLPARNGRPAATVVPQLRPASAWARLLNIAFRQDPTRLFDADGNSVIIAREIIAPSVVDSLKQAELGQLKIEYLMETVPTSAAEARRLRDDALGNPLYRDTLASADGRAVDRKSTRLNSSHSQQSRMPSSA